MSKKFGPMSADHPMVTETTPCPACRKVIKEGDFVALVPIGPGENEDERQAARDGSVYNAVAVPAHWACVTGEA